MKNNIKLILAIIITITIVSCEKTTNKKQEKSNLKETVKDIHHHENGNKIQLDHGKMWTANAETTQGIKNMQKLLDSFSDKESVAAYALLKINLEKEFGTILTKCTMKGESHKQLHNYLLPMKNVFEGLSSSDLNTCKKSFETLQKHLDNYSNYFK
jgi:hypothetical protein